MATTKAFVMQPIAKAWFCQIELTNICTKACVYCTRYVHHVRKDQQFYMTIPVLEKALESLEGWPNRIGIIGGEPTLHPQFEEVCRTLQQHYPPEKLGLWTSGGKRFDQYRQIIADTFGFISYNEHNQHQQDICKHQPLTVALGDVIADPALRRSLIDQCWVQEKWCPSISPKGTFFCEVACSLDMVLDGPGGWPVEKGWWKRTPEAFEDQIERYCNRCGMCVPLEREAAVDLHSPSHRHGTEKISPGLLAEFRRLELRNVSDRNVEVFGRNLSLAEMEQIQPGWTPYNYREDIAPDQVEEDSDGCWLMTTSEFFSQYKVEA